MATNTTLPPEVQARLQELGQLGTEAPAPLPQPPKSPNGFGGAIPQGVNGDPDSNAPTINEVNGTSGNNILRGTNGIDNINGKEGNDRITGFLGDDVITAGPDSTSLPDDDNVVAGGGNDRVYGGAGNDLILGDFNPNADPNSSALGDDSLNGGPGNDYLFGQNGNDTLNGNDGTDFLYGGNGDDTLDGRQGNDTAEGGAGNDRIFGGSGDDLLLGDDLEGSPSISGNDTINGGSGNDQIFGGRGNDALSGDTDNDEIIGNQGNDSLSGGDGKDKLIGTDTVFFGLQALGFGKGEIDTLTGGRGNDTFALGLGEALARDASGNEVTVRDVVLYNDGVPSATGTADYALIKDFGFSGDAFERGVDKIELAGSSNMYSLGASPISSISGTGIFFNQDKSAPELIGIVEKISLSNLSLTNTNQFAFV